MNDKKPVDINRNVLEKGDEVIIAGWNDDIHQGKIIEIGSFTLRIHVPQVDAVRNIVQDDADRIVFKIPKSNCYESKCGCSKD
jgi:hypothetical protein